MSQKPIWRLLIERLLFAGVLVFLTYNTFSNFSYYHWVWESPFEGFNNIYGAAKIVTSIILFILYLVLFHGAYRSKGAIGIILTITAVLAIVYLLQTAKIIDLGNGATGIITSQIVIIIVLALGSIWSILWRRIFGQVSVEDPDTD